MAQLRDDLEALDRARDAAREVLVGAAEELGADAVVGLRFETTALGTDAIEVIASGTAVRVIRSVDGVAGSPSPGEGYSPA
jgi:uncharacterized protein YbjQ (UPF0145 family)